MESRADNLVESKNDHTQETLLERKTGASELVYGQREKKKQKEIEEIGPEEILDEEILEDEAPLNEDEESSTASQGSLSQSPLVPCYPAVVYGNGNWEGSKQTPATKDIEGYQVFRNKNRLFTSLVLLTLLMIVFLVSGVGAPLNFIPLAVISLYWASIAIRTIRVVFKKPFRPYCGLPFKGRGINTGEHSAVYFGSLKGYVVVADIRWLWYKSNSLFKTWNPSSANYYLADSEDLDLIQELTENCQRRADASNKAAVQIEDKSASSKKMIKHSKKLARNLAKGNR